ncbi:MAG TPA: cytochrome c [Solirubrobacteraceae bacterium]|nr:cytochrome c [Solirubrobacteraceae bacterium]
MTRRAVALAAACSLGWCAPALAAGSPSAGEKLFAADCSSCHTIGGGDRVGPDLKGVVARSGRAWVRAFIANPDKAFASGDPKAAALLKRFHGVKMPNFGLAAAQVDDLVAYLAGAPPTAGGSPPAAAPPGDAAAGERLFSGATALAHGGPACISCHTVAGVGAFGGGNVGRDLTRAYSRLGGAAGIQSLLAQIPFPGMRASFAGHPLTARERADLAAYLRTTVARTPPADPVWALVGLGLGVSGLCVVLAFAVWPRRRRLTVRRSLFDGRT